MVNYEAVAAYAGEFLAARWPDPIEIGGGEAIPDVSSAVYIALGMDDGVLYVGSVHRPEVPSGLAARLDEHLRTFAKRTAWNRLLVVPLVDSTPESEVRRIEGRIGAHLAPLASKALPGLGGRPRRSR